MTVVVALATWRALAGSVMDDNDDEGMGVAVGSQMRRDEEGAVAEKSLFLLTTDDSWTDFRETGCGSSRRTARAASERGTAVAFS